MSPVLWQPFYGTALSLLLGLRELTLLGSVPPKGRGGCTGKALNSKAFGWSLEIFLTLPANSLWDGAWQDVVSDTGATSWIRADYRWCFLPAWLLLSLALVVFTFQ